MKLVWNKTGDEIELKVLNQDLFYSWLDFVNSKNVNTFYCHRDIVNDLNIIMRDLNLVTQKTNQRLAKAKRSLPVTEVTYSQAHLNLLHRRWVELQLDVPGIKTFLELHDNRASIEFDEVNELIHAIEHRTKFPFGVAEYCEFSNPCMDQIEEMTNQQGHIFLSYKNLGRTCWHKYVFGDDNLDGADTNNWDILGTDIVVDLTPVRRHVLPQDYIDLCRQHNVPAVGLELPLACFSDPIDWARLRTVMRKNILKPDNSFSFIC